MKKRLLALSLVLIIVVSLFSVTPVFAASDEYVQLLNDLGIIEPAPKVGLIKKGFTRGDFAKSLVLMDGAGPVKYNDTDENGNIYASDIASNVNKDYIIEVIISGMMQTDVDGKFNPGKAVTIQDAVRALIKALGYETVAQKNGGTDSAYYMLASALGLFKGVNVADENKLSHEEVAQILANAMSVRFLDMSDSYIDDGINCFFDYLELTSYNGKILANSNFGIAVDNTSDGFVNIDGTVYRTNLLIPDELVGSEVTFYTKDVDGFETVVSIYEITPSDAETVLVKDIYDITEDRNALTIYYNEEDKLKIDKSGFAIVNTVTKQPTKKLFESLSSGSITFVKSKGSGNYDLAHITMLKHDVIDGISAEYGTLTLRYSGNRIDLGEPEKYELYVGKKSADISTLKAGMPVGIACDTFTIETDGSITYDFAKANIIKLYASNATAEVIIDGISDEEFVCGGFSYEPGYLYKELLETNKISALSLNVGVTLYLDNYGQIAYYENNSNLNTLKYGYLIAAEAVNTGFDKHITFRIMDTDGNINDYKSNKEFILDGIKVAADSTSYSVGGATVDLTRRQAIKYMQFDGIIKRIDTIVVGSNENQGSSLKLDIDCNAYDIDGAKKYTQYKGVVASQCALTEDTVVFVDEANLFETGVPENYNFSVIKVSSLPNKSYIDCYDVNDLKEAGCAVMYTECGVPANSNSDVHSPFAWYVKYYVVERVTHKIDKNGEQAYGLVCAGDGQKVELNVPKETLKLYTSITNGDVNGNEDYTWATTVNGIGTADQRPQRYVDSDKFMSTICEGDIIRYRTNTSGDVNYIERVFDFSEVKDKVIPVPDSNGKYFGFVNVTRSFDSFLIYNEDTYDTNGELIDYIVGSVVDVVPVYHVERGVVTMEKFSEIPTASTGQVSKAFVCYYDTVRQPSDHIIYLYD